jgi:hypothetical protein
MFHLKFAAAKQIIRLVAILLPILLQVFSPPIAIAQIKGDTELLKMAAVKYRANIEKLKTWKGDVKWTQKGTDGICEWTANYACDFTMPAKRWAITIEKNVHVFEGKVHSTPILWNYGMFREGAYYELSYSATSKNNRHGAFVQNHPFSKPGFNNNVFDPEYFFTYEGTEIDKFCLHLYKNRNSSGMTGYFIKKEGNNIIIDLILENNGPIPTASYNIDLSKAGNVTQVIMRTNETFQTSESILRWEWKEINGVWVPNEVTKDSIISLPEPKEYHDRIVWENNEVNIPLASDEFSLIKLGVRQEDMLFDTRTNTRTIIKDKSFPPHIALKKKSADGKRIVVQRRNVFWGSYFTIGSIVGLIVMGSILIARFIMRKHKV